MQGSFWLRLPHGQFGGVLETADIYPESSCPLLFPYPKLVRNHFFHICASCRQSHRNATPAQKMDNEYKPQALLVDFLALTRLFALLLPPLDVAFNSASACAQCCWCCPSGLPDCSQIWCARARIAASLLFSILFFTFFPFGRKS